MVTKYRIPCSCCGKIVERYVYCSGACKVKGFRDRKNKEGSLEEMSPDHFKLETEPITVTSISEQSKFSDKKKVGYHYSDVFNTYVKD